MQYILTGEERVFFIKYLLLPLIVLIFFIGCKKNDEPKLTNLNNNAIGVLGHRGAGVAFYITYPINTLTSIKVAIEEMGADGVEIDVQLSKDNQLMLYHDEELQTITSCNGMINSHTKDELSNCLISSDFFNTPLTNYHLAALEEVFERYANHSPSPICYLDIKPYYDSANFQSYSSYNLEFAGALNALILKHNAQESTLLSSVDIDMLRRLKLQSTSLKLIVDNPDFNTAFQQASSLGLFGITINYANITRAQIEQAHANNLRVILWGVDTKDACRDAARLFPDYVETDNVLYMISLAK